MANRGLVFLSHLIVCCIQILAFTRLGNLRGSSRQDALGRNVWLLLLRTCLRKSQVDLSHRQVIM